MTSQRQLMLQELCLRPSGEWTPDGGWTVARVVEGAGYCLQRGVARELNAGDIVITGPQAGTILRASQLGFFRLEFYLVQPQFLNGLLTFTESRQLEDSAGRAAQCLLFFPATDAMAQKFARIAAQSQRDGLSVRSALFQLWAAQIAGLLPVPGVAATTANNLRDRFRQIVGRMSEADLATRSLPELAGQLHCSGRHFSRLFHEEFHVSLRERQTELRLQRARQLLVESDAKIINIAYESGYRHLGLFNAMFKRRFGVTPSQCRQQNASPPPQIARKRATPTLALLCLLLKIFFAPGALAQSTNAPAPKPAATTNAAPHFKVEKYLVSGNTVLAPGQISQVLSNLPAAFGTNVSFADIRAALADLQMAYRERGYVTVSVGLPQQKLTNAEVKIKVTEGRLADIKVQGNHHFSSNNVMRALPSLHTNLLLNSHVFQRELDQANANRDRQVYPVISPGVEPGTTELALTVKDRLPLHARVEINNTATPGTPDSRVVFNAQYNNLWQLEHQAGLSYSFTPVNFRGPGDFYWSPLDLPLLTSYSAFYRLPLAGTKPVQQQIDDSSGQFGYNEVTHQFQMPPPSGRPELTVTANRAVSDTGVKLGGFGNVVSTPLLTIDKFDAGQNVTLNEGFGAKVSWPLPQFGKLASTFLVGADFKHFEQISYNTNSFSESIVVTNTDGSVTNISSQIHSAQPVHTTEIFYLPINLGVNGSLPDSWGSTFFNLQANFNLATFGGYSRYQSIQSGTNLIVTSHGGLSEVAGSPKVHDNYLTLQFGADRLQRVYKDWTVKVHADGQWANGALFSNEQFGMGGAGGVRGYPDGQAYGDAGWRVSVEPQTPLINIGMVDGNVPFWFRFSMFMDYGQAYLLDGGYFAQIAYLNGPATGKISGDPSVLNFWGTGWSMTANIGSHLDARFTMGFPLENPGVAHGWSPLQDMRFYFAVGGQF
jgi:hemolysin activation/secretion protein